MTSKVDVGALDEQDRLNLVEYIVTKRTSNLEYLKRVHGSNSDGNPVHWFNVVAMTNEELETCFNNQQHAKRIEQWFCLGVSMAPLLNLPNGFMYVRALSQLMEEFDFYCSSPAVQGMKLLKARTISNQTQDYNEDEPVRPEIKKSGKIPVFEFLRTPSIPCSLDYREVVFSLCELLTLVYRKFYDDAAAPQNLTDAILKLDGKIKHHFLGVASRALTNFSMNILKQQVSSLDSLFEHSFEIPPDPPQ